MRKLLLVYGLLLSIASSTSAQVYIHGGGGYYAHPHVSVGIGVGIGPYYRPFYPYYGYGYAPYFAYPPYGYGGYYGYPNGYGYQRSYSRPTKLDLQIQNIKDDYNERIYQVKHDKNVKRKQRKELVHELEIQRDKAIIQAQRDYYLKPEQPQQQQQQQQQQQPRRHNFSSSNTSNL